MKKEFQKIIELAKEKKWTLTIEEQEDVYTIFLGTWKSPAGREFCIQVEAEEHDIYNLLDNIEKYYEDFDVSYETYLWLDDTGHGHNGAPYDMKDLYEDTQACEDAIWDLLEHLRDNYSQEEIELSKVKVGDIVVCYDEYTHDYDEHLFKVNNIEEDEEGGIKLFGVDLSCVDEETNEYCTDEYISYVHVGNFIGIDKEEE